MCNKRCVSGQSYHLEGQLVSIRIQWRNQVYSDVVHQAADPGVFIVVLLAHELHEQEKKLST